MSKNKALEEVVAAATDPNAFDLDGFIKAGAISLPTKTVDCLTDLEAGYRIAFELNPQIDTIRKSFDGTVAGEPDDDDPELKALTDEVAELQARIQATRITFHLRGVAPAVVKILEKKALRESKKFEDDEDEANVRANTYLLQSAITKVELHKVDQVLEGPLGYEHTKGLVLSLPDDQQGKLISTMGVLVYGVILSANSVDAGFPGGTAGEAGELSAPAGIADGSEEPSPSV